MMMAGERSIVNLMADTGIGGSTIKNEWTKALAKGLIPKTEHLTVTGFRSAQALRNEGKPVIRVSGQTFVDPPPVLEPKVKGKSSETGASQDISEKTRGSEKVRTNERAKALRMMMAGERSAVNIMSDTGLGGTTVKNEWQKAMAKGVIPKTERLSFAGITKANDLRNQGNKPQRISGQPFDDQTPVLHVEDKPPKGTTGEKKEITENTRVKEGQLDLSGISEQISTSMKSMELQLKNGLGVFDARLKEVERAKSGDVRTAKSTTTTKSGTIDLRQGVAEPPPPETTEITEDPGDENEVGDDDDEKKEPPEGKSRVIFPDGQVAFIPTPYAEQMAKNQKGLRLIEQDVKRVAGVGENPYQKEIILTGTGTRRVVEINPKTEIIFDYFMKKHQGTPEMANLTAFVNMAIDFFAWTQNTKREKGR